jgi:phosphatidylglycerol:prolipoprotein diacylglycerol transferase
MMFPEGLPPTTIGKLTAMGVRFPAVADPSQVVAVHPTQIYETVLMFLAFWWMWRRRDHGHATGWMLGCYLVLGGAERFFVEFLRAKDDRLLGSFTVAQATSAMLVVVGAVLLKVWWKPDAVSGPPPALASSPKPAPPPPG